MLFVIISDDVADSSPLRAKARPKHIARLNALRDDGRLIIAGPCPAIESDEPGPAGFTGSVVIAEFDSLNQAQDWAGADPYVGAGVYQSVTVKPFKLVLP
ncbi:MAG: YciI family protein [Gammaproteobacteria bacterium]|nr:YciI family protein [Gammaproteobacteria bacterium]